MSKAFTSIDKRWFDRTMQFNKITGVQSIKADASTYDFRWMGRISFAIIDVDLYLPTRKVLDRLYDQLADGGILVVDDYKPDTLWDGSFEAYKEFVLSRDLQQKIVLDKLGVIEKKN